MRTAVIVVEDRARKRREALPVAVAGLSMRPTVDQEPDEPPRSAGLGVAWHLVRLRHDNSRYIV